MINISVDISSIASEFTLSGQEGDALTQLVVNDITRAFVREWDVEVKANLRKTRNQYRAGMKLDSSTPLVNVMSLEGKLPNMIEQGASSFDMKLGFLSSPKVKFTSKGNPYITIPFRFGTPDSIGENFSGTMPQVIYDSVRRLPKDSGIQSTLKMHSIPSKFHIPKSAALRKRMGEISMDKLDSSEKTSIYAGIQRTSGGYVNFRRVSLNSQADSWIHPGLEARNFMQKALDKINVEQISDTSIDEYLTKLGF